MLLTKIRYNIELKCKEDGLMLHKKMKELEKLVNSMDASLKYHFSMRSNPFEDFTSSIKPKPICGSMVIVGRIDPAIKIAVEAAGYVISELEQEKRFASDYRHTKKE